MRFGYIARSMGQRPHNAPALRHLNLFRLIITLGGSIAAVYSRPQWPLDYELASNSISERLRGGRIKDGLACTYEKYIESRNFAENCRADFGKVFGDCDVLLAASATGEAPVGTNSTGNVSPSAIWTTVHVPVMTIPVFKGPHGLPVGAQLIARRNDDRKLFSAAQWVYRQLD